VSEYKHQLQTTIPDDLGGKIVGGFLGVLVLALGLRIIKMGYTNTTATTRRISTQRQCDTTFDG